MRILWVKAGGLVPLDTGGKIRSYHTIRELAGQHDMTVYTFYERFTPDPHDELKAVARRVMARPLRLPARRGPRDYLRFARALLLGRPYSMWRFYTSEVRGEVRGLCHSGDFDVLVCDFVAPAGIIPWHARLPKVLFTHNVEAEIWARQAALAPSAAWKLAYRLESRALARTEVRYARLADEVIAVSRQNAEFFAQCAGPDKVTAVPTGVDTGYFQPAPGAEDPTRLVFTGSMDWTPNEDCVVYFVEEILPLVRAELPAVSFWVAGRRPSSRLRALADGKTVQVTGDVEDIRPYLQQAALYVVPMRSGSGTRLKIYEAMASGKAVVSTTVGAEGLGVTPEKDIVLADSPPEFAQAVTALLRDAARRRELGAAARVLVEERYSWAAAARAFEGVLLRAVRRRSTAHPG